MSKWLMNASNTGFSLLCYIMILFLSWPLTTRFSSDIVTLFGLGILTVLSFTLVMVQRWPIATFVVVGLKLAFSLLVGIPLVVGDGREELLFYALFADCLLFLPEGWGIALSALALLLSIENQHAWKTWDTVIPAASASMLAAYTTRLALVLVLASGIRIVFLIYQRKYSQWEHLESSIQAIIEANQQFQVYAIQVEKETAEAERKRITREIHDIIGYSLTNQLMALEASILLVDKNPVTLKDTLVEARQQLQAGLEDIRSELRNLHAAQPGSRSSLSEFHYLCRIFQEATGVRVNLDLAVQSSQLEPALFHCLYRIIQQGLTNSFFHGQASLVEVCISEQQGILHMTIIDNGQAGPAKNLAEHQSGIGLVGMAERLTPFGGTLEHVSYPAGFQLNIRVPLTPVIATIGD